MKNNQTPEFEEILEPGVWEKSGFGQPLNDLEQLAIAESQKCLVRTKSGVLAPRHADDYYVPYSKTLTAIVVVECWLQAQYEIPAEHFSKREPGPDPPDVVLVDNAEFRHGIEVTELVDETSIKDKLNNKNKDSKDYNENELRELIAKCVAKKSTKKFKTGPYKSKILLICSAELSIAFGNGPLFLSRVARVEQSYFDEVWFMIPPPVDISGGESKHPHHRIFKIPFC